MVEFTRCHFEHLSVLNVADVQTAEFARMQSAAGLAMVEHSTANTAWRGSLCLGVAGILPVWPGRAEAWSFLSRHCRPRELLAIVSQCQYVLRNFPASRIEMTVKAGNKFGDHLAQTLGFTEPPVLLRKYHPFGHDMTMYAMVRDG